MPANSARRGAVAEHHGAVHRSCTRARRNRKQAAMPTAAPRSTHVVFSTGCTSFFDWQSLGLAYSHAHAQQSGRLTRLLSRCPDDESRRRALSLPLMTTHEHPDFGVPAGNGVQDTYGAYNKPAGIAHWLMSLDRLHNAKDTHAARPPEGASDFILILELEVCDTLAIRFTMS